jgi:hypothetical protein
LLHVGDSVHHPKLGVALEEPVAEAELELTYKIFVAD